MLNYASLAYLFRLINKMSVSNPCIFQIKVVNSVADCCLLFKIVDNLTHGLLVGMFRNLSGLNWLYNSNFFHTMQEKLHVEWIWERTEKLVCIVNFDS